MIENRKNTEGPLLFSKNTETIRNIETKIIFLYLQRKSNPMILHTLGIQEKGK
jgi:hypothetical protein